ncbi:hypothetical protein BOTBODRAFT_28056 [Botryobasidium botryosum FD-172 SS1]|uniref:Uncharacterized protein n=1 Tax=Botryobasidium botryosum (strain FD-172 SS1) TaxID=930990 RepID=A0A067N6T0_BOTB1|nr:hypothetical protein BOTBODRAFT_28056 [Botryobasidium botryosum FD-172 SS1]
MSSQIREIIPAQSQPGPCTSIYDKPPGVHAPPNVTKQGPLPVLESTTVVDQDASANPPQLASAEDTLGGLVTSKELHDGLGHPGQGMSSKEVRHDGQPGRKKQELGADHWGKSHEPSHRWE